MSKQVWSGLLIGLALSLLLVGACGGRATPTPAPTPAEVEGQEWSFPDEGVQVMVPPQDRPVHVVKLPLPFLEELPVPVPGGFEPFRPVINFDVVYDDTGTSVQEFDPPIQIWVRYTSADFQNAANEDKPLSLGFCDESTCWRYTAEKHSFQLVPDGKEPPDGGLGVVLISSWGDPTQVWGR